MILSLPMMCPNPAPQTQAARPKTQILSGNVELDSSIVLNQQDEAGDGAANTAAFADLLAQLVGAFMHQPAAEGTSSPTAPHFSASTAGSIEVDASINSTPVQSSTDPETSVQPRSESGVGIEVSASLAHEVAIEHAANTVSDSLEAIRAAADAMRQHANTHISNMRRSRGIDVTASFELSGTQTTDGMGLDMDLALSGSLDRQDRSGNDHPSDRAVDATLNVDASMSHRHSIAIGDTFLDASPASPKPLLDMQASSGSTLHGSDQVSLASETHLAAAINAGFDAGAQSSHSVATSSSSPLPTSAGPTAHTQLVNALTPLRHRGDGTYDLTLELHPAELGTVRVRAVFDNGTIQLHLNADSAATRDLLQGSLHGLRSALDDAGLRSGQLSVDVQAGWQGHSNAFSQQPGQSAERPQFPNGPASLSEDTERAPVVATSHSSSTSVDVLL